MGLASTAGLQHRRSSVIRSLGLRARLKQYVVDGLGEVEELVVSVPTVLSLETPDEVIL